MKQQEAIQSLEAKLNELNSKINYLLSERENVNMYFVIIHIALIIFEVIIVVGISQMCVRFKINSLNIQCNSCHQQQHAQKELSLQQQQSQQEISQQEISQQEISQQEISRQNHNKNNKIHVDTHTQNDKIFVKQELLNGSYKENYLIHHKQNSAPIKRIKSSPNLVLCSIDNFID